MRMGRGNVPVAMRMSVVPVSTMPAEFGSRVEPPNDIVWLMPQNSLAGDVDVTGLCSRDEIE